MLNFFFTLIEIAGGLYTNSIAILSDALHDAGDCLALGSAWYLQNLSRRQGDAAYTYGYKRFSPLGAVLTGTVLSAGMVVILYHAIPRLANPEKVDANGMLGLAVLGVLVNGFAAYRASRGSSLNEEMVSWHLLEDVLGWVAVLIGGVVIKIWGLYIVDPLLSIGISLFILINVVRNLVRVSRVFLQGAPEGFDFEDFRREVLETPKVLETHHSHCWTLDGESHVMSAHVVMEAGSSRADILAAKQHIYALAGNYDFDHLTLEIELAGEECCLKPASSCDH